MTRDRRGGPAQGGRAAPHRPGPLRRQPHAPGTVYAYVVRSPFAHARITQRRRLEGARGRRASSRRSRAPTSRTPGPAAFPASGRSRTTSRCRRTCRSRPTRRATSGDGVAVVVAESRAAAKDAAELVEVDYEPLPAVTDVEAALARGRAARPRRRRPRTAATRGRSSPGRSTRSSPRRRSRSRSATASSG